MNDHTGACSVSLEKTLARLEASVAARRPESFPKRVMPASSTGKVVQLPLWPELRRGIPNDLVRGALFTVGNSRMPRAYRKTMVIASLGGIAITYTGEELRHIPSSKRSSGRQIPDPTTDSGRPSLVSKRPALRCVGPSTAIPAPSSAISRGRKRTPVHHREAG